MEGMDWGVVWKSREVLWSGMLLSLKLFVIALGGGIFFGTLLAMARLSSWKVMSYPAAGFVNLIRSIPFIMAIFWFYFLTPMMVGKITGQQGEAVGPFTSALVAFIMVESAYYSEIIRAGIQSIPRGQVFAGQAMGMTYGQNMRLVILPQAFRNMLPVLLTQTIILFQDTSLVYAIGAYDLLKGFETVGRNFNRPVETYLVAAAVYFAICYSLSSLVRQLQKKIQIIR